MSEIIEELKLRSKYLTDKQLRVLLFGILDFYKNADIMSEIDFEKIIKIAETY